MTDTAPPQPDAAADPEPSTPTMFAIVRLNTFDEHKLATATGELREFGRLHASQPGYAGSLTVALGEGRHLIVNLWDSERQASAGLSNLRAQVGRALQPLMTAPSQLIGAGPVTTDLSAAARTPSPSQTTEFPLPDGVWSVDPQRSEVGFAVKAMWGLQTVRGIFGAYDGSLNVRAGGATGKLTIKAASLDTGNNKRDQHLRSPDFFDVERHPRIMFTATAVTAREGALTVTGELVIGSSHVRLDIPVSVEPTVDGALRLDGQTTTPREAAGIAWNKLGMIRGDATLHAQLTLKHAIS
jgi:polyisoprenoid-binding protein YceI